MGVLDEQAMRRFLSEDPAAAVDLLVAMVTATDEELRAAALRLGCSILLERSRQGAPRAGGVSRLLSVRASQGGDVDLDASLEAIISARSEGRPPAADDLVATQWGRPRTAFAVVIDRSGSMTGERLAVAAVVAAACAAKAPGEHAVLSFATTVDLIRPLVSETPPGHVVESLLRLRGHGVTRLADALRAAGEQLSGARAERRVAVLLSDCRPTDDDDSVEVARGLPELIVLAPADDHEQAERFAEQAGARWAAITDPAQAAVVLTALLGGEAAQQLDSRYDSR